MRYSTKKSIIEWLVAIVIVGTIFGALIAVTYVPSGERHAANSNICVKSCEDYGREYFAYYTVDETCWCKGNTTGTPPVRRW